jgi:hypothetical protein
MASMFELNTASVPSSARAVNGQTGTLRNNGFTRHLLQISVTARTGDLVVTVERQSPISGAWVPVLATPAIVATGETTLEIGPGLPVTANQSANALLGANYRISWTVTASVTFSVSIYSQ